MNIEIAKKITIKWVVSALLLLGGVLNPLWAQEVFLDEKDRIMMLENQLWHKLNNAAGLGASPLIDNGLVELGGFRRYGTYNRPQEGKALNRIQFNTEKYTNLKDKIYLWGKFEGALEQEYDRAWSDVFDKDNGNPYQFGSTIKGKYVRQLFSLEAKVATRQYGKFNYGFSVAYKVGDQARVNDPRPRSILADYKLSPSIIWQPSKSHRLGLDVYYRFNKEKLTNITAVQDSKNFGYYDFLGMENYREVSFSSFTRNVRSYYYGGNLQYNYDADKIDFILNIGYGIRQDKISGIQNSSPGNYQAALYYFSAALRGNGSGWMHSLDLSGEYKKGFADYYKQETRQQTDEYGNTTQWWETIYKALAYRNSTAFVTGDYKLYQRKGTASYTRYLLIGVGARKLQERYILPVSTREILLTSVKAGYGDNLITFVNRSRISFSAETEFTLPFSTEMELNSSNTLSENVYVPELLYYKKKNIGAGVEVRYDLPVKTRKGGFTGYIKLFGNGLFALNTAGESTAVQRNWMGGAILGITLK